MGSPTTGLAAPAPPRDRGTRQARRRQQHAGTLPSGAREGESGAVRPARARSRRRRPLVALSAAALLAAALILATRSFPAGPSYSPVCVYPRESISALGQIDALTGHDYSCVMAYDNADPTWATWEVPWFATTGDSDQNWAHWVSQSPSRRLIITLSLVPSEVPTDWREVCASGAYDGYAEALGRNLVGEGLSHSVLRISPEANDPASGVGWVGNTSGEMSAWAECWADEAKSMAVPGSHFLFDWTVNAGYEDIPFSDYYPGDAAVDIIGIDAYDALVNGQGAPPGPERWRLLSREPGGIDYLAAFAKAHGKPLSVPEWGEVAPPAGAGDDPYYVQQMAALFKRDKVAYESYFDEADSGTLQLGEVPESLRAYRELVLHG